jgi:hypothetical protein
MSRGGCPPRDPDVAVRIIYWLPANDQVVLAPTGPDKKSIGDVFYASAAARGEADSGLAGAGRGCAPSGEVRLRLAGPAGRVTMATVRTRDAGLRRR